jgi:hypothetical protein
MIAILLAHSGGQLRSVHPSDNLNRPATHKGQN